MTTRRNDYHATTTGGSSGGVVNLLLPNKKTTTNLQKEENDDEEENNNNNNNNNNNTLLAHLTHSSDIIFEYCSRSEPVHVAVSNINAVLQSAGAPSKSMLTADTMVFTMFAVILTLGGYFVLFGKRNKRKRKFLENELRLAKSQVHKLEEELLQAKAQDLSSTESNNTNTTPKKQQVRIFLDGAFDMMHYGHMNAFRLGKSLGTHLIVGINSDASITECKGAPLMNDSERLTMVEGCKFVDQVVPGCPYVMNEEYLDYVFETLGVDLVVHGDDPCVVDGKDVYEGAKRVGKFMTIPRTQGVSSTDIVGRMLILTKEHHCTGLNNNNATVTDETDTQTQTQTEEDEERREGLLCEQSEFLTTSRMLRLFSAGMKAPEDGMRVIYMDGAWDMFHSGHVSILKEAKKRGDYLIVGVHGDAVVNKHRGGNLPLMNLHERVLSVMGCRYVDDVLIDAPYEITPQMVLSLNIAEVVRGSMGVGGGVVSDDVNVDEERLRYKYPMKANIFKVIESPSNFDMATIVRRIRKNQEQFQSKITKKKLKEKEYLDEKFLTNGIKRQGVQE